MKNLISRSTLLTAKINKTHLQFAFMLLTLVLLVLGAGAPEDIGGIGR
jgi:hypothetical protein